MGSFASEGWGFLPKFLPVVPSQQRKIKFHVIPSFSNPDPLAIGTAITFLSVSFCVPIALALVSLEVRSGAPIYDQTEMWFAPNCGNLCVDRNVTWTPFVAGFLPNYYQISGELWKSSFLLDIFGNSSGPWEDIYTLFGLASNNEDRLFDISRHIYSLSWGSAQERIFLKYLYGQKSAKFEADIQSLVEMFFSPKLNVSRGQGRTPLKPLWKDFLRHSKDTQL